MLKIINITLCFLLCSCATQPPVVVSNPLPKEPDNLKVLCNVKLPNMTYQQTYREYIKVITDNYYNCYKNSSDKQDFIDLLEK